MRVGNDGRDFEYISGEDPFLGAELVGPLIKGIQSNGVMANMKHFINNNQEINRRSSSSNIDERTEFEMYYPPFKASIEAGVGSAMCSYNLVNHIPSCANNKTLNRDLREIMGFDGFVMSDWGAIYGNVGEYLPSGCDQEQGSIIRHFTEEDIKKNVKTEQLDKAVNNIVKSFIKFGLYEEELPDNFSANVTSQEHQDIARKGVEQSTILLKNEKNVLPLQKKKGMHILVLGNQAGEPVLHGTGSGNVP
jgi:beta-glucosidase